MKIFATLALLAAAVPARAAVIDAVAAVPALPAGLSAAAAVAVSPLTSVASLSAAPLASAPALAAVPPARSLPAAPYPIPLILPAAPSPIGGPATLPGVKNPVPLPQPLHVADVELFDRSFLDRPARAASAVATVQLNRAAAAAKAVVDVGAVFDAARP